MTRMPEGNLSMTRPGRLARTIRPHSEKSATGCVLALPGRLGNGLPGAVPSKPQSRQGRR